MTYNSANGVKLAKCDSQQWKNATASLETSVKFAGEEAKDRLYEPKHKKKLVRVLTVVAYVFFVSLAAIMLSMYYVLFWNGDQKIVARYMATQRITTTCQNNVADMSHQDTTQKESDGATVGITVKPMENDENTTWSEQELNNNEERSKSKSIFIKKLMSDFQFRD